jgi:2'-5' RNA ligase
MPRLFIAIPIPSEIRNKISKQILTNPTFLRSRIRWVSENNLHITLKFLGEIPVSKIPFLKEAIRATSDKTDPFEISLSNSGVFPNRQTPRVIWIGIHPPERLIKVQECLESNISSEGFPEENKKFHPHLTLGRIPENGDVVNYAAIELLIKSIELMQFPFFSFDQIQLIQSTLTPQGPDYYNIYSQKVKNMLISGTK